MEQEQPDPTGLRYYGSDMTIHGNTSLDVETDEAGHVVAVWFRCQPLLFKQVSVKARRAAEMRAMYAADVAPPQLEAVVLKEDG
jgi:hypothetical protein